jgi:hypothetical protein
MCLATKHGAHPIEMERQCFLVDGPFPIRDSRSFRAASIVVVLCDEIDDEPA